MKSVMLLSLLLFSLPSFAAQARSYVKECTVDAINELKKDTQFNAADISENSVTVTGTDDRWYNPYKYVWFDVAVTKVSGEHVTVQFLAQKSILTKCSFSYAVKP